MTMWIILGVLAVVVLGIISVMSVIDRKKAKKVKAETLVLEKETDEAKLNVATDVLNVIKKNQTQLKKFIPSVGKIKMSDIKNAARKALKEIEQKKAFKLSKEEKNNQELHEHFSILLHANSNLWDTKYQNDIKFFEDLYQKEKSNLSKIKLEETENKKKSSKAKKSKKKKNK